MTKVRGQSVKFGKGKQRLSKCAKFHSCQTAPCLGWQYLGKTRSLALVVKKNWWGAGTGGGKGGLPRTPCTRNVLLAAGNPIR